MLHKSPVESFRLLSAALLCLGMILALATACSDDEESLNPIIKITQPSAAPVAPGDCLNPSATAISPPDSNTTCIDFTFYADSNRLILTHHEAIFNCCPHRISFDVTLVDSLLLIEEHEDSSLCDCICSFDVTFAVEDLTPGDYHLTIVEEYLPQGMAPIEFDLSLAGDTTGTACVGRQPAADSIKGNLIEHSGCKSGPTLDANRQTQSFAVGADSSSDYSCIEYTYDGSTMHIDHINSGFNCCIDSLHAAFVKHGPIITIAEWETFGSGGACHCLCLFDMELSIENLKPGVYRFVFLEPYWDESEDRLDFYLDLRSPDSGRVCVYRSTYPWGTIE